MNRRRVAVFAACVGGLLLANFAAFRVGRWRGLIMGQEIIASAYARRADDGGAPDAQARCNGIPEDAPSLTIMGSGNDRPAARGGELREGTYRLTKAIVYKSQDGFEIGTSSATLKVAHGAFEGIRRTKVLYNDELKTQSGAYRAEGGKLHLHVACPAPEADESHDYTADGDRLEIFIDERSGKDTYPAVLTYERVPE